MRAASAASAAATVCAIVTSGDRADTARHRRDSRHNRLDLGEVHVATQVSLRVEVDAHVKYRLTRAEELCAERPSATGGADDHVAERMMSLVLGLGCDRWSR